MKARIPGAVPPKAEATEYSLLFEANPMGALVFEDLVQRFGGKGFVKGGIEGERQTTFNLGQRAVIDYIINQINRANGVEPEQPETGE